MTHHAYLSIVGRKLGHISRGLIPAPMNDKREPEHIDKIKILSYNHTLTRIEAPDGLSEHPFFFSKFQDRSTPLLVQTFAEGEIIDCEVTLYRESQSGTQQKYFTFHLEGGVLTSFKTENQRMPSGGEETVEQFGICYRRISETFHEGNTGESFPQPSDL